MIVFNKFLDSFPNAQLLCWVGSGEPPIANRTMSKIQSHFQQHGSIDRVGFDVQVSLIALQFSTRLSTILS